jgi:hypothetical protein
LGDISGSFGYKTKIKSKNPGPISPTSGLLHIHSLERIQVAVRIWLTAFSLSCSARPRGLSLLLLLCLHNSSLTATAPVFVEDSHVGFRENPRFSQWPGSWASFLALGNLHRTHSEQEIGKDRYHHHGDSKISKVHLKAGIYDFWEYSFGFSFGIIFNKGRVKNARR